MSPYWGTYLSTRNIYEKRDFSMTVGKKEFASKDAREAAGNALIAVAMEGKEDATLRVIGSYKGMEKY